MKLPRPPVTMTSSSRRMSSETPWIGAARQNTMTCLLQAPVASTASGHNRIRKYINPTATAAR